MLIRVKNAKRKTENEQITDEEIDTSDPYLIDETKRTQIRYSIWQICI